MKWHEWLDMNNNKTGTQSTMTHEMTWNYMNWHDMKWKDMKGHELTWKVKKSNKKMDKMTQNEMSGYNNEN
jgi:hypothetical protein